MKGIVVYKYLPLPLYEWIQGFNKETVAQGFNKETDRAETAVFKIPKAKHNI